MRTVLGRFAEERLRAILTDPEGEDAGFDLILYIGEEDYSDALDEGQVGAEIGAPAISLSLTLADRLPKRLWRAPVTLWADCDGIMVPLLFGALMRPQVISDELGTEILAASPGALLPKVNIFPNDLIRNVTSYSGWQPERVIQDAIFRCAGVGGYDKAGVRITEFGEPLLYFTSTADAEEAFEYEQFCNDILAKVADQVLVVYRDTPEMGFEAIEDPGTGESAEIQWVYDTTGREILEWATPTPTAPDEDFTNVIVRDKLESGLYRVFEAEPVDHNHDEWSPFPGQILFEDFTDIAAGNAERARQQAVDRARSLGGNEEYQGTPIVSFNPLYQVGDVLHFFEEYRDKDGLFRLSWRAVIDGYQHNISEGLETELTCRFYLTDSERLSDPITLFPPVASKAIISYIFSFATDGLYARNVFGSGVYRDETGTYITPSASHEQVHFEKDGLYFELVEA